MRRPRHFLALLLAAGILLPACSEKLSRQTGLSDGELLARGEERAARKKHESAAEHFQALLERFPTSPLAARAQLALADARMENGDMAEAEVAYDDFMRLYPSSDNVPYALYRKGELLFRQVRDPRRDQTRTRETLQVYSLLLERNPSGPYAAQAAARIAELRDRLADHEARVASHYLARRKYESAEARARRAIAEYPDARAVPTLLSLLAQSLQKGGKPTEAAEVRRSLAEKFPGFDERKRR
jgi:outer membrane protein assembly factor BamD